VNEFGQGGDDENEADDEDAMPKALDQDTKELKPTAPVASANATGAEGKAGAKKRK